MSGEEFAQALVRLNADYIDLAAIYIVDRKTTYRWLTVGPPNTVARLLQALMLVGLSLPAFQAVLELDASPLPDQSGEIVWNEEYAEGLASSPDATGDGVPKG